MQNKPLFLIVTPSFNQAQFISKTIDSVISQKGNFEIAYVVMDGGSSDGTKKILENQKQSFFAQSSKDGKARNQKTSFYYFESKKDKGQTDAINKGIRYLMDHRSQIMNQSTNQDPQSTIYFAYINSDDYYLAQAFEKVSKAFQDNPSKKWLVGDAIIIDENEKEIQTWVKIYKQILRLVWHFWPSLLFILNPIPQPSTFIRWSAIEEVGSFDEKLKYVMDYQYWLRMQNKFGLPIFLNEPLSYFRIHGLSKGGSQFEKQFAEQYLVANNYTKNKLILLLHQAHNWVTTNMYRIMK